VIKVESVTVCGTDLRIMRGEKSKGISTGLILGHEIAGTIVKLGDGVEGCVEGYEVGQLCGVSPTFACGVCRYCQSGLANLCGNAGVVGNNFDGALADFMLIPELGVRSGQLVRAPDGLPPEELSLAEPLSCCLNGLDQYRVDIGDVC
jgi:threonine dehydrogenase-like Zn-dependent dehydrogenase